MKPGIILICSGFLLISCSKDYDPGFFNGEWLSDSLITEQNDHWREFLYFDNGHAARTTVWGKQYLLNKNLSLKGLKLYDRDKELFQIKVIDSNKIVIKGRGYYGSFYKESFQMYDMKTAVSIAEKTETERKKLIGNWKAISSGTISASKYPEDTIYTSLPENRRIGEIPTDEIQSVNFGYNKFSFRCKNGVITFGYTAEKDKIEFSSGDMILSFKYSVRNNRLIIEYTTYRNVLNTITFEKVQ
ncbi:hypothetical protein [Chryseobacterium shigense]|uniref:Lipocalin-like domain-containing protein n=1 Tax=Chryseobacterium shigense TaxID=297244 RepID=A0A841N6G1_9FLAO|nr:hypothetical protein [Chryseobacterium shigense]MBB6372464.1 hypothetical protein [Chryseobacterium shigense]